jgi:hypothetical protein
VAFFHKHGAYAHVCYAIFFTNRVFAVTTDSSSNVGCSAYAVTFTQKVKFAADSGARSISCMTVASSPEQQQQQQQHEAILLCGLEDGSIRLWILAENQ